MTNPEMTYHPNGKIQTITYRNAYGNIHNDNGSAFIKYFKNEQKEYEEYFKDGKRHNVSGPAYIIYYPNGEKEYEEYYKDGQWHNDKGPALITYSPKGQINYETYYVDGKELTKEEFMNTYQKGVLPELLNELSIIITKIQDVMKVDERAEIMAKVNALNLTDDQKKMIGLNF